MIKIENSPIGLVGPLPPPFGGMANQAELLYKHLSDSGLDVRLIRTNAEYRPGWVKNIKGLRAGFRLYFYILELWRAASQIKIFHVLSNSGWSWYLFSVPVLVIARMRGVPVIINYRGGEAEAFFERSWRWVRPTLNLPTLITVPTGFLQEVFKKRGIDTSIVPNIIDLSQFSMTPTPIDFNDTIHIIVTRNLEEIYGNDIVIRAFPQILKKFPKATLTIAGSGPQLQALKNLRDDLLLSDKVKFAGRLNRDQIIALYKSAHLMINASHIDNSPNSIIEALASAVPVVSSGVGGIPFLVTHNVHALLLEENNPEELAEMTIKLIEDASLREKLIENGLDLVRQFDWNAVRPILLKSYGSGAKSIVDRL